MGPAGDSAETPHMSLLGKSWPPCAKRAGFIIGESVLFGTAMCLDAEPVRPLGLRVL